MKIICHLDTFGQCLLFRFEKIKEFNMPEGVQMTKKIPFANVILLPVQVLPQQKKSLQKRKPMNAYFLFSRNENRTYTIISNSYCPPRSWGLSVAVFFIHCKYIDIYSFTLYPSTFKINNNSHKSYEGQYYTI